MDNDFVNKRLRQLLSEVQSAGGTTFELLGELDNTSDAYRIINEIDSQLSVWEDDIEELMKHL